MYIKNVFRFGILSVFLSCAHSQQMQQVEEKNIESAWYSVNADSVKRDLLVQLPSLCRQKKCPLVFVFHGGMGDPEQIEKHSQFTKLAAQQNFIVVYPRGLNRQWNDGRPGQNDEVDDMKFFDAMFKELKSKISFDEKRVFTTGISNGGFFSFRLACERAEIILAAAPIAANHSVGVLDKCKPSRPVSILNIVGTEDQAVPYDGGTVAVLFKIRKRGEVLSSNETLKSWVKINACEDKPEVKIIDQIKDDSTSVKIESYTKSCREGASVIRMSVVGGGHTWPGHPPSHRGAFHKAVTSLEIDATEEAWNFFKAIKSRM